MDVIEQWCVVASQVAPLSMHQQLAADEHVPGSRVFASTQACVALLHTSPPHALPDPPQSASFVHGVGVPPDGIGFSPGATWPPPLRVEILALLLFSCPVTTSGAR